MATSGSTNWTYNRNEIITRALRIIGHLDPNETAAQDDINACDQALNALLKSWNNTILGFQLWKQKHGTLFLNLNKHEYTLGPNGDHATTSFTSVETQAAAVTGDKVLVLPVGASAGTSQLVGVVLNSGDLHWSSISATQTTSGTVSLVTSLSASVSASAKVFLYTDKMENPTDLIHVYYRDNQDEDEELDYIDRRKYFSIYDKDRDGEPQRYYFQPGRTDGKIWVDWEPDDCKETIKFVYRAPLEDFDNTTDEPDLPQEWIRALVWGLAAEIGPEFGVPIQRQPYYDNRASSLLEQARSMFNDSPRTTKPTEC